MAALRVLALGAVLAACSSCATPLFDSFCVPPALCSLVAWARQQGHVALYIPSAFSLVQSEAGQPQAALRSAHAVVVLPRCNRIVMLWMLRHAVLLPAPSQPDHPFALPPLPAADGTFSRGEDGLWDTPEAARWILSSLKVGFTENTHTRTDTMDITCYGIWHWLV